MPDFGAWSELSWSALAYWVTAAILLVTAIFAAGQIREARQLREAQARPFVVVDFEPGPSTPFIDLVIENVGKTLAKDVQFSFDPQLQTGVQTQFPLSDTKLLRDGVPTMPPAKRISAFFDSFLDRMDKTIPSSYSVIVTYKDSRGTKYEDVYELDLSVYEGLTHLRKFTIHEIGKTLDKLQKDMARWRAGFHGLLVYTRDYDQHQMQLDAQWVFNVVSGDSEGKPEEEIRERIRQELQNRSLDAEPPEEWVEAIKEGRWLKVEPFTPGK